MNHLLNQIKTSITLELNELAEKLAAEGKTIYNFTAGQLPFAPPQQLQEGLTLALQDKKSFRYAPARGVKAWSEQVLQSEKKRLGQEGDWEILISNGAKHTLNNIFGTLCNPGDEVVLLAPYWVSYEYSAKLWGAVPRVVKCDESMHPCLEDLRQNLNAKTQAVVLNSPNNPTGIHYSRKWMQEFAQLIQDFPHVKIVSDEIYRDIVYSGEALSFFYEFAPQLLERTIIVNGISKKFAATGLRIGYACGPREIISAMTKLQSHATSSGNTLVQNALTHVSEDILNNYLDPIKKHIQENALLLENVMGEKVLGPYWYQPCSAFYFLLSFKETACVQRLNLDSEEDPSARFCEQLLEETGIVLVPGSAFASPWSARMSLVAPPQEFKMALEKLQEYLTKL